MLKSIYLCVIPKQQKFMLTYSLLSDFQFFYTAEILKPWWIDDYTSMKQGSFNLMHPFFCPLYVISVLLTFFYIICQVIPQDVVRSLLMACKSGDFDAADKEVSNIIAEGYPVSQMLCQVTILLHHLIHFDITFLLLIHSCHWFNFNFSCWSWSLMQTIYQMNKRQEFARNWVKQIRLVPILALFVPCYLSTLVCNM